MKRSTPEERRWANGLRQATRPSNGSVPVGTPAMRRNGVLKRPSIERSESGFGSASLAATAALQAYLSKDIDAQSRIPRPRPAQPSVGKEKMRLMTSSDGKRLSSINSQQTNTKLGENTRPNQVQNAPAPAHLFVNAVPSQRQDVATRAKSPLSRFQKHLKQIHAAPVEENTRSSLTRKLQSPNHPISQEKYIPRPSENLTQSLMDKIQEAKRLRQVEELKSSRFAQHQQSGPPNCVFKRLTDNLKDCWISSVDQANSLMDTKMLSSPEVVPIQKQKLCSARHSMPKDAPIPHAKPVMPTIPLLPSPLQTEVCKEVEQDEEVAKERAKELTQIEGESSVNDVITTIKAVQSIQRIWRRKRTPAHSCKRKNDDPDQNQVTLVIDKENEKRHVPLLFSNARTKCQKEMEQQQAQARQSTRVDLENATIDSDEVGDADLQGTACCRPSYDPWIDHELVFLEEGRCIGELQESVRKGISMDQEELVWKRPQHVIQQLETQRVATIQKTRRKRPHRRQDKLDATGDPEPVTSSMKQTISLVQSSTKTLEGHVSYTGCRKRKRLRVRVYKLKNTTRGAAFCTTRTSSAFKPRKSCIRVQRIKESRRSNASVDTRGKEGECVLVDDAGDSRESIKTSSPLARSTTNHLDEIDTQGDQIVHQNESIAAEARTEALDRFVLFSDFGKTPTTLPRNDLICVGDLALAGNLLHGERHCQAADEMADTCKDFIPLTMLPTVSQGSEVSDRTLMVPGWHDEKEGACSVRAGSCVDIHPLDHTAIENCSSYDHRFGSVNEFSEPVEARELQMDNQIQHNWSSPTSPSRNHSLDESRQNDPMQALEVMRSTVTETMAQLHTKYRDDNQELEEAQETAAMRPQLDEAKRLEFLRVLNDFKRCLQLSSVSASSARETDATETSNQLLDGIQSATESHL